VLWGALFSLPAGSSFTALRFSTLFLSLTTLLLLLLLVRSRGERLLPALLAPLLLLFNPAYLDLSHTFMTDVPFIALTLGSILLLVRGTDRGNKLLLALGMCLGVLATLLRQTGMLIPVAFGIGYLSRGRAGTRRALFAV
jgi:4-amino-4-deoxy-L-arabinose transferase-like glycosyltransferase